MAELVFGMATSHAFALLEPSTWEPGITMNRRMFHEKWGREAPLHVNVATETLDDSDRRYDSIRQGHTFLRDKIAQGRLDALVLIGDDQNEHFTEENLPALAMYVGDSFECRDRGHSGQPGQVYRGAPDLARHLLVETVEHGFDVNSLGSFKENQLKAHAFGPVLNKLGVPDDLPVVPVFVEAIHYPAPTPARCYEFGKALRAAIESWDGGKRVAFCASGGLSHFTAGYPYQHVKGDFDFDYGSIDESYDRQVLGLMETGDGRELGELSNYDLLEHGEIELRSWITGLGMIGEGARAQILAYEPFYSGIMGMGVAFWDAPKA